MVNAKSTFESGIGKLARILARQFSVNVVFKGNGAYTDGKTIYLPSIKDLSKELTADINGFCDHEVGHVRYTTMKTLDKIPTRGRSFNFSLLNALEDVRVERLMIKDYPGCAYNLDALNTKYLTLLYAPEKFNSLEWPVQLALSITAAVTADKKIPKPNARIARLLALVDSEVKKFNLAKSTDEVLEITTAITNKIFDEIAREKAAKEKAEKEKGEKVEDEDEGEGAESSDDEAGDKESNEEKADEADEAGDKESNEEKADEADEADESDEAGDEESEAGEGEAGECESESVAGEPTDEQIESGNKMMTGEKEFKAPSVDEYVNEQIKSEIKESSSNWDHLPSTTEYDQVIDKTGTGSHVEYLDLRKQVSQHTASIKRQFEKTLKIVENARWQGERERGQINQRSLTSLITQPNYRTPFKQLKRVDTTNVVIQLLVDLSASMRGRMETAKMSVIAIAEALLELGFEFEVTGFTSVADPMVERKTRKMSDSSRYNRTNESLRHFIFKRFGVNNLSGITEMKIGQQNVDGESVRWAAKRLGEQKQKRKILMVFSDGSPAANGPDNGLLDKDLIESVKMIEKSGIETIGIGIQTDAVKRFYKNAVVVSSLEDLPKKAMSELTKIILKGR